jgi:hypothetical protein
MSRESSIAPGRVARRFLGAGLVIAGCVAMTSARAPAWRVSGELTAITADASGAAVIVVGGRRVAVAADLGWSLPGQYLTAREILAQAPRTCAARQESGLLRTDSCVRASGGDSGAMATVSGNEAAATDIVLHGARELVSGGVTFVNRADGYIRIGGIYRTDTAGSVVRLNDPTAALSVQQGQGCGPEPNCSPDVRFRVGLVDPTVRFTAGIPACVPALAELFCAATSRYKESPGPAPIRVGDHAGALGMFREIDGVRVLFAHTVTVDGSGLSDPR